MNLTDSNSLKFIVYGKDMSKKTGICDIYLLQNKVYQQLTNLSYINFYEDKFEVDCIFNQKGKYKVKIFGNRVRGEKNNSDILEYIVNVSNNVKNKLSFPKTFKGKEDINIIEPIYNNLKSGEKVKFKIKSNLEEIIIIDGKWNYLKKNEEGYFEFETTIQSQKGKSVIIGKPKPPNSCDHLVSYDVI
jgi:ribosomal protein L20A (L18A)